VGISVAFGGPLKARRPSPRRRAFSVHADFAYAKDLQPSRVFLGNMPDEIDAFDIALRPIALSEID
jgi:hypothetical protein